MRMSMFAGGCALLLCLAAAGPMAAQNAAGGSGVLVALDSGKTIWIAPVAGKFQAIATDDYIIPRKDGFWRIHLDIKSEAELHPGQSSAPSQPSPVLLWAVPLGSAETPVTSAIPSQPAAKPEPQKKGESDATGADTEQPESEDAESAERISVMFLGPDYLALETQSGEYADSYSLEKISDVPGKATPPYGLQVSEAVIDLPNEVLKRDQEACAKPGDDLADADFLGGATQSFGIQRSGHKWRYAWMFGYDSGAARGYHTLCAVSKLPPKYMVGADQLFPPWNIIKNAYPDAVDAFSSPGRDIVLLVLPDRLIVAPIQDGKPGRSLLRIQSSGRPVMVQWAIGKYVARWTEQLSSSFKPYIYVAPKPQ